MRLEQVPLCEVAGEPGTEGASFMWDESDQVDLFFLNEGFEGVLKVLTFEDMRFNHPCMEGNIFIINNFTHFKGSIIFFAFWKKMKDLKAKVKINE